jgi:anaerobic ribonucleoside-triphosphate reductase
MSLLTALVNKVLPTEWNTPWVQQRVCKCGHTFNERRLGVFVFVCENCGSQDCYGWKRQTARYRVTRTGIFGRRYERQVHEEKD